MPFAMALLLAQALAAPAQDPDPRAAIVERIVSEALSGHQAYARLQSLCEAAPRRLSGSADAERAIAWARDQMTRDGHEEVRLEPCSVPRWERGKTARLEITSPAEARGSYLPILAIGGSVGTPESGVEAPVAVVAGLEEVALLGEGARGKILFFNGAMDPRKLDPFEAYGAAVGQRAHGAVRAARAGAMAAVVRSMTLRMDDLPHTGGMRYEEGVEKIPAAALSTAGAARLSALLEKGPVTARLSLDCRDNGEVPSHNVVGELRGASLPEEVVVIGAHLDAWDVGTGAHDDGAGCAHVLEALRLLRVLDLRPARTIRAVLFMNEENGLRGALAYRDTHKAELARHVLAIESDRGGFTPRGFETNAEGPAFEALRSIAALLEPAGAGALRKGGGGADVSALVRDGVPVMDLIVDAQRYFDVHHCSRDTLDTVHPRELELGAVALAVMAYFAANAGEEMSRPSAEAPGSRPQGR